MKIITYGMAEWNERLQRYVTVEEQSYDYDGPVASCSGGDTTTVQKADPWIGAQPYLKGQAAAGGTPAKPATWDEQGNELTPYVPGTPGQGAVPGLFPEAAKLYGQGPQQYYPGQQIADPNQAQFDYYKNISTGVIPATHQFGGDAATYLRQLPGSIGQVGSPVGAGAYTGAAQQSLLSGAPQTQYLDPMVQASQRNLMRGFEDISRVGSRDFGENVLGNLRTEFGGAGQYGGSRHQLTARKAARDYSEMMGREMGRTRQSMGDIGSQMYGKAYQDAAQRQLGALGTIMGAETKTEQMKLDRDLGAGKLGVAGAALLPGLSQASLAAEQARLGAGNQAQQYQQSLIDAEMRKHQFGQEAPGQALGQYAGIIQPGAGLGGTTTSTGPGTSSLASGVGMGLTGASLGASIPGWGAGAGTMLGPAGWGLGALGLLYGATR